jgi:ligand-binding sensor domain-containing protein/signal transduction histidine kinase
MYFILHDLIRGIMGRVATSYPPRRGTGNRNYVPKLLSVFRQGLVTLALFTSLNAQAQEVTFDHISVEHGLTSATVNEIYQDRRGFMWFGTADGLCRFDGYDVTSYKHDAADSNSISDNLIWSICEPRYNTETADGSSGVIWIGTYGKGLNKFDRGTEKFTHYKHDPSNPKSLSDNYVKAIYEDNFGNLWIATYGGGLDRLIQGTEEFEHFRHDSLDPNSLSDNTIRSVYEDRLGVLWLGTNNGGLNAFDKERKRFTHYEHDTKDPHSISPGKVGPVYEDHLGVLWVGTTEGLDRFDRATNNFAHYKQDPANNNSLSNNGIYAITEDNSGALWIATFSGLNRLDPVRKVFTRYSHRAGDPKSLSDDQIRSMYKDSTGSIWIGTVDGGVNKISTEKKQFIHIKHDLDNPHSLSSGVVWSICQDRSGVLWVGTSTDGLNEMDRTTQAFRHYRNEAGNPRSLSNNYVSAIFEDSYGTLWVGTWGGGINKFDRLTRQFTRCKGSPADNNNLCGNKIWVIYEDKQRTLWIGTWEEGLFRYDRNSDGFRSYRHDPKNPKSLSHDRVTSIFQDHLNTMWIGTEGGGLNRFDRSTAEFTAFRNDPSNPKSISNNSVQGIVEDTSGHLWIGTYTGLNKLLRETGEFEHYSTSEGIASDFIKGMINDDHGDIWLCTGRGVSRFIPERRSFRNYDVDDGLQSNVFTGICSKGLGGEIFLGGAEGFNVFHPDSIKDNPRIPPVVVTIFRIFERPAALETPVIETKKITLAYNEDFFSFVFAALDFTNPAKNTYAYMMEGFDREWIYTGNRRYASYTNLDPGDYVFKVKGANNDGVWNEAGTSVQIIITPPFWQRWWFRILTAAVIIAVLTAAYNYRVSKLLEMERMRVRIASDLHDDIGSSLSSIALITDMVRKNLPPENQGGRQLADVSRAARHTADALKDIVWIITPEHEKVDDIILRMKDAAAKLLVGIDYSFHCTDNAIGSVLDMEFRRNVLLMYKETLNNLAKYSHATHVDITLGELHQMFQMTIKDNGIGFDEATIQHGNGLKNLRHRAEKIGGTIKIRSSPGGGTTVDLIARIP